MGVKLPFCRIYQAPFILASRFTCISFLLLFTDYQEDPFVRMVENTNGEPAVNGKHYEGYCIDLLKMVADRVNFQYSLHVQYQYGAVVNGSWTGMVGELVRKVSDLVV